MLVVMRRWAAAQGDLPERALRDPDFLPSDSWAPFMCNTETAWTGMMAALRIGTDPHFVCAAALAPPKPWVHHLVERSSSVGEVRAKTAKSRKAKRTQRLN